MLLLGGGCDSRLRKEPSDGGGGRRGLFSGLPESGFFPEVGLSDFMPFSVGGGGGGRGRFVVVSVVGNSGNFSELAGIWLLGGGRLLLLGGGCVRRLRKEPSDGGGGRRGLFSGLPESSFCPEMGLSDFLPFSIGCGGGGSGSFVVAAVVGRGGLVGRLVVVVDLLKN